MTALELYKKRYCGDDVTPSCIATGFKATTQSDMICDCDDEGECCGN